MLIEYQSKMPGATSENFPLNFFFFINDNSLKSFTDQIFSNLRLNTYINDSQFRKTLNPLSANPTKWSNILKKFVGKTQQIVWVCLTISWGWCLKV